MDEYSILRKKQKKNAFAATSLLISIALALLVLVGAVLILGKVDNKNLANVNDDSNVTLGSGSDASCVSLTKEMVFGENLRNIKETAISYFTNERLPQNVGDTVKITLKEMQDLKLILNVIDGSYKLCSNDKSYVEVTKEENEYIMKIFLSCSDMEDYILVHLGCYNYCESNICEKQETYEYEYKKTTNCVMSDWSGWGNWQTTREKISNLKKEDTKVETSTKEVIDTKDATKVVTYNCDKYPGYTLVKDKCIKKTTTTDVQDATPSAYSYNCDKYPGYTLVGTKCVKTTTTTDTQNAAEAYNCNKYPGYTLSGNKCTKTTTTTDTQNASVTYNCNNHPGYTLNGDKCTKTTTDKKDATPEYSTRQVSYTCYKEECTTTVVFSCPNGKTCGNYPQTSCETVQKTCYKTEQYISGYNCKKYKGYTLSGKKCVKKTTDTQDAAKAYNCNNYPGYTLSGNKCTKTTTTTDIKDATKTYNCNNHPGYTLNGNKCTKTTTTTDTKDATKVSGGYVCPDGYTLNGKKCSKTTTTTDTKNAASNVKYTCPDGYTKNANNTCSKKTTQTIKTTYYRYATRSCNGGSTSTKWSTSKNDSILLGDGYKLTGNKRKLIVK